MSELTRPDLLNGRLAGQLNGRPYRRQQLRADLRGAYDDGTTVGFCLGLTAAVVAWFILSGTFIQLAVGIVQRALYLLAGAP